MMKIQVANGISFSDEDVVNVDDWIPEGDYNPHRVRPWLLHDHGYTVAVAFGSCEGDAIDSAVDAGKLDRFQITGADQADYEDDDERIAYLGNAGEPFDIESLGIIELDNPRMSFAVVFMAGKEGAS
jgi:hypothetical protein